MAIPAEQQNPYTRKLGSKPAKRVKRTARSSQAFKPKPPRPPPNTSSQSHAQQQRPHAQQQLRVLDLRGLQAKGITLHRNSIIRLINEDRFPRPFSITERRVVWWESEIDEWLLERARQEAHAQVKGKANG